MKNEFTIEELKQMLAEKEKEEAEKKRIEEEARAKKLAEEKDTRYKEIEEQSKKLSELIKAYSHDYGSFSFKRSCSGDDFLTNFFWNRLFF